MIKIEKQGDFFVESPIILLAAIIWYLKIYKNRIYCTFPHAVELLNKPYSDHEPPRSSAKKGGKVHNMFHYNTMRLWQIPLRRRLNSA